MLSPNNSRYQLRSGTMRGKEIDCLLDLGNILDLKFRYSYSFAFHLFTFPRLSMNSGAEYERGYWRKEGAFRETYN